MLQVTTEGRRHARHMAACFDAYLATGIARRSASF
jgi:oxygen-independent coproporphyrinogen-3 oxidase